MIIIVVIIISIIGTGGEGGRQYRAPSCRGAVHEVVVVVIERMMMTMAGSG
jgi:hypothetical protein